MFGFGTVAIVVAGLVIQYPLVLLAMPVLIGLTIKDKPAVTAVQ